MDKQATVATFDPSAMNQAAEDAAKAFKSCRTAQDVCVWWKTWYPIAGHRRLGRFLVSQTKGNSK